MPFVEAEIGLKIFICQLKGHQPFGPQPASSLKRVGGGRRGVGYHEEDGRRKRETKFEDTFALVQEMVTVIIESLDESTKCSNLRYLSLIKLPPTGYFDRNRRLILPARFYYMPVPFQCYTVISDLNVSLFVMSTTRAYFVLYVSS